MQELISKIKFIIQAPVFQRVDNSIPWINHYLGCVVQKVDSAIHWINHYPADSVVCFVNTYPLDNDLSGG